MCCGGGWLSQTRNPDSVFCCTANASIILRVGGERPFYFVSLSSFRHKKPLLLSPVGIVTGGGEAEDQRDIPGSGPFDYRGINRNRLAAELGPVVLLRSQTLLLVSRMLPSERIASGILRRKGKTRSYTEINYACSALPNSNACK